MPRRESNTLNIVLILAALTMIMVLGFAAIAIPNILTGTSNSQAVRDSQDLSSCRAQFAAAVTDAQAALIEAKAELDVNTNQSLRAATVDRDPARLAELLGQAPDLEAKVKSAIGDSAVKRAAYVTAIDRAIHDPNGFLSDCRSH